MSDLCERVTSADYCVRDLYLFLTATHCKIFKIDFLNFVLITIIEKSFI